MVLKVLRRKIPLVVVLAAWVVATDQSPSALAGGRDKQHDRPFQNYYVPPGPCGGVGAQLYVAPRPTPPLVGHTYVTYQPLAPHEFLYKHHSVYYRQNPGAGWTRTKVLWR